MDDIKKAKPEPPEYKVTTLGPKKDDEMPQ